MNHSAENQETIIGYFGFIGIMTAGGAYTLKAATIEALPIPSTTTARQKPIIDLVDRILVAKKRDPAADTSALEREIDEKVYRLYGLTDDEIRVIEGKVGESDGGGATQDGGRGATALPDGRNGARPSQRKTRTPKFEEEF